MKVGELLNQRSAWLAPGGDESGVVVSSRIRLARNLQNVAFPGWAGEDECERVWQRLRDALARIPSLQPCFAVGMGELDDIEKSILFERHLISQEEAARGRGSGVVIARDESAAVMVNEEDHLRLQAMTSGLRLQDLWRHASRMDDEIEEHVRYAFSPRLGYLTACPTNIGTGLRASVMLHVPGLVLMNEINPVVNGLGKIGLAVRGLWGEGTEAVGNMFQVSNQITMGDNEEHIIQILEQVVRELVEHEQNARQRLLEKRADALRDHVGRARGILAHAHVMTSKEALNLLSGLRLGVDLDIMPCNDKRRLLDELWLLIQPGHLQKLEGRRIKAKERDRVRAGIIRARVAELGLGV